MGPTSDFSEQLHAMKYRQPGETFRDAMGRIASALTRDDTPAVFHDFRDMLLEMRFMPAGRVQSSVGAARDVTPYNCYVSGTIPDSFVTRDNADESSIMHRAEQAAQTMRMGGGIGYDFSTLRPRGALIQKLQSNSSGPLAFMKVFDAVCRATASAGHRRGAQMGVLRVDHPDVVEFVNAKHDQDTLSGFNISVAVTDEFMEAVARGSSFALRFGGQTYQEIDARELWENIMRSTWDWAEPGVLFIDTINRYNNLWYTETIAATNPCFTGDTRVWTLDGHKTFRELAEAGKDVDVLTQTTEGKIVYRKMRNPRMTQRAAKLVEVTVYEKGNRYKTGSVRKFRCTPEHVVFLNSGRSKMAKDLRPGDSVASVYRQRASSAGYLKLRGEHEIVFEHHAVVELKTGRRPMYPDEHVHHIDENKQRNVPDNLEIKPATKHRSEHMHASPPSKRPEVRQKLRDAWTPERKMNLSRDMKNNDQGSRAVLNHRVISVEILDDVEDVYCGTVDETSRFFIALGDNDGVLVHNCGEQPLPPFGACLLGSFNLARYIVPAARVEHGRPTWSFDWDQLEADIPLVVRAMDRIPDIARYPLPEQQREALAKRRMGLGVCGLANAAETLGMPYGSPEFVAFEERVLSFINRGCYRASALLASERGAFPLYDAEKYLAGQFVQTLDDDTYDLIRKHGIRNSHLTSIAPTGTISMCADNVSSGIEPVFSEVTQRPVNTPEGPVIVEMRDYALDKFGTRARVSAEVTAQQHIDVLVAASRRVDSAVSKTCNVPGDMPWADFKEIYRLSWERGAKGCTTFNASGKRMALLTGGTKKDEEPEEDKVEACVYDPATGTRTCDA